jgi:5'-3' exonuclease
MIEIIGAIESVDSIIFTWDSKKSYRKKEYPGYKKKPPLTELEKLEKEELFRQMRILRTEALPTMGFANNLMMPGLEADDIIAWLTKNNNGSELVVVTSDHDLYQLLDNCKIYNPAESAFFTKETLLKKWNATPDEWGLVKAIAGCTSDNVIGVNGIGEKKAINYLHKELSKKMTERVWEAKCLIEKNKPIVILPHKKMIPIKIIEDFVTPNRIKLVLENYGMFSLLKEKKLDEIVKLFCKRRNQ